MMIHVDLTIYSVETVLRACHTFTGRCYVALHRTPADVAAIELTARDTKDDLHDVAGAFHNALLDQQLRAMISEETRAIRELLVAQAFSEADLLDRHVEGDEYEDPRGIGR